MITQSPPGLKLWFYRAAEHTLWALPRCQAMAQHCFSSSAGGVGQPPIKMH